MKYWWISDPHFGHEASIKYCDRPFKDVHEMNETLVNNWNAHVRPEDTVFVLGDLSFLPYKEFETIAKRLNGIKFLIKGNHDKYSDSQYRKLGFTVFHEIKMKIAGQIVRMSHYPYALPWYKRLFAFKSELRFMDRRPPKIKGEWLLHGHSHVKYRMADNENRLHVGVEAWDFRPVSLREIESLMAKRLNKKD